MALGGKMKTEHAGAKNGGGFWGRRIDAKLYSRKKRRIIDRKESKDGQHDGRD